MVVILKNGSKNIEKGHMVTLVGHPLEADALTDT